MQIDLLKRTVSMNVGEVANFRQGARSDSSGYAPWRAKIGQKWHKTAEAHTLLITPDAKFEQSFKAHWQHHDWSFIIQGRIDQVIPEADGIVLREVKSIQQQLPCAEETLIELYPTYFAQTAIYKCLAHVLPEFSETSHRAELHCINIDSGVVQTIPIDDESCQRLFEQQLDALTQFLDQRRSNRVRLNEITIQPAFEELREGQAEVFEQLQSAGLQSQTVLLEAPTGFGKTGIVLEHALKQMQAGLYERCIYLTSKSTGQLETIRQLQAIAVNALNFMQMRNRNEHAIESAAHTCTGDRQCEDGLLENWRKADLHACDLFTNGTLTLERAQQIGAQTGVCPYTLTKSCLAFSEVWIGDLNYVFAPQSETVFQDVYGFDPQKTLLIVDEAHNLPDRAAAALSAELKATDFIFALEELRAAGAPRKLISIGNELSRFISSLKPGNVLSTNEAYEALDLCEDFAEQLQSASFDYGALPPFALDCIWSLPLLAECLAGQSHEWLFWSPNSGVLQATCLDASDWIASKLKTFSASVLMSATLSPIETFSQSVGIPKEAFSYVKGMAAWRENAYDIAIDLRVDTRLKRRSQYHETTARTVASLIQQSPGEPVAVFFASYQYAENIRTYLEAIHPELRVAMQPRGVNLAEQEGFIDSGLILADALFLILGSSYAEGVDKLGGKVRLLMIVGPALAEVNAIQTAKMDAHPSNQREVAFSDIYIQPAMRRIHQALGRIVRAPGHKARVLLHGRRFAEAAYHSQIAPEYSNTRRLKKDSDLDSWLNQP